jgi:hypothetical protein
MAGGIGNLTVGLGLDAAEFTRGLTKAQADAERSMAAIQKTAASIAGAFAGFVSISAFKGLVVGAIDAADHLNDLSKKTGIAVETLGGIGFAASQAGGDLESAAAGTGKLNKSLAEAAAGNKEAAEAFQLLGINVKDAAGNTISADKALAQIADRFAGAADGPEKVALALRIFGKAGADIIPLLNDGGKALQENIAYYERFAGVTTATAAAADQFNDTLGKVNLLNGAFGRTLAAEALPTLQRLADLFLQSKESGKQFQDVASGIVEAIKGIALVAYSAGEVIGGLARGVGALSAQAVALAHLDFRGFSAISDSVREDAQRAGQRISDFYGALYGESQKFAAKMTASEFQRGDKDTSAVKGQLGRLKASGSGSSDDPSRRLIQNQIKALDDLIGQERDLYQTRNKFLDLYNSQGLLSIQGYYDARNAIISSATSAAVKLYDQELATLQKYRDAPNRSAKDRAEAEGKIQDVIAKRAKAEREAGEQGIELAIRQAEAQEQLRKAYLGVESQVQDLQEEFAKSAATRFDTQFDALRQTFSVEGNQAGLEAIQTLRDAAIAQAEFQKASLDAGRSFEELSRQEDYLAIAQQNGAINGIQALALLGEARRAQIPLLEAQVQAEEAVARASGNRNLIDNAEQARLALEKLKAAADPLGDKFREIFQGDAADAFFDFASGAKNAASAFKSFADSVQKDLLRIASRSIAEDLFGKGGAGGGIGGVLGSIFGSSASGGGPLASLGKIFSGFFADGGFIPPGKFGVVGERGPELAFGGTTGKTIAPVSSGKSVAISVNVQAQPGMSRDSAIQQGATIGAAIQRSLARNG